MKRFDGILLCSDFDGTLRRSDWTISRKNTDAIEDFVSRGGRFTIVSGRSVRFINDYTSSLPVNAPIIAANGSIIADEKTGRILHLVEFDGRIPEILRSLVAEHGEIEQVHIFHGCEMETPWFRKSDVAFEEYLALNSTHITKVVLVQEEKAAVKLRDEARKLFGELFRVERSWPEGLEFLPLAGGKGNAIRLLKSMTGAKTSVGVGDFENDVSLLRDADIGIAVGNALPCVKEAADFVTVSCEEDAIAHVIYDLL